MAEDLLEGVGASEVETSDYLINGYVLSEPMVEGQKYTLSVNVEELTHDGSNGKIVIYDGGATYTLGEIPFDGPATYTKTFTYFTKNHDLSNPNVIDLFNTPPRDTKTRACKLSHVTLASGDKPASGGGGSMSVLSSAQVTLAWSAGILATVRYYQLAAPTAATPTVPTSSSKLGSWTETEPTADVTKVLWTCERTVYADGTESWSKASKSTSYEAAKDAKSTATDAQSKAQEAKEQVLDVSARIGEGSGDITATIETRLAQVRQDVDATGDDVSDLSSRLSDEIRTRQSFMRFSEESSDPTLTLGQTDSPAQVKLTNKQLQFLYMAAVVAYISGDALLIRNATILQQLVLGGFAFVPRENGNLSLKWVG